ncbi:unnamed protein product, partial [Brassica oleracea]
ESPPRVSYSTRLNRLRDLLLLYDRQRITLKGNRAVEPRRDPFPNQ